MLEKNAPILMTNYEKGELHIANAAQFYTISHLINFVCSYTANDSLIKTKSYTEGIVSYKQYIYYYYYKWL